MVSEESACDRKPEGASPSQLPRPAVTRVGTVHRTQECEKAEPEAGNAAGDGPTDGPASLHRRCDLGDIGARDSLDDLDQIGHPPTRHEHAVGSHAYVTADDDAVLR